jgi:tRNA (guanine-N7-)-methyltransferase
VHIYFPDPWPKKRHHKRRLIQEPLLTQLHRVLEPGGRVRLVTDHADYWQWMLEKLAAVGELFEQLPFDAPASADPGEMAGTNFERKYRREGRPLHGCVLRRRG